MRAYVRVIATMATLLEAHTQQKTLLYAISKIARRSVLWGLSGE